MKHLSSVDESGRSLVEMLGTIAIITMITIGGIAATRAGMDTYRTNNLADQIDQVAQNTQDLYSWQRNYDGLGTSSFWIKNCKDVAKSCTNGKITPIVGGEMTLTPGGNGFIITVTNIPAVTCHALKNKNNWGFIESATNTCPPSPRSGTGTIRFQTLY